jgi:GNAT superfamily N-acetyltransferase
MADVPFLIERLSDAHHRASFACGVPALDRHFANQVTQDIRRRIAACTVAVERASATVIGYATLAASSVPLSDLADPLAKKLPRYPLIPAVRVGRLAVAMGWHGKGIGSGLLVDAITRAIRADIIAYAIVVDAKDEKAAAFYQHHGFVPFQSVASSLYLPLAEAAKQLGLADP